MARRQEITAEIIEAIVTQTREAHWPHVVARKLGVHKSVYQRWMDEGEKHHLADTGQEPSEGVGYLYRQLYEQIQEAEAEAEMNLLHALKVHAEAGKTTWNGYMNTLERRFPDRWRKKDAVAGGGVGIEQALQDFLKPGTSTRVSD